jgi:hypothetical protein
MTKINFARVLLGGLAAGVVLILGDFLMHGVALGEQWTAAMAAQGVAEPGTGAIIFFCILDLIIGIAMVWLYAAIRPRFGAGGRTAIVTGIVVWFFGWFWQMSGLIAMGMYPSSLIFKTLAWGFFQIPIAAYLGAWLYKE